jgi:hypothetical protein
VSLAAIATVGAAAILSAQAAPARAPAPDTVVVMGCVSQQPIAEAARSGQPVLVITDTRYAPPRRFILQGNSSELAWHVGHTLEVHAHLLPGDSRAASAPSAQLSTLEVQSVIYLQPTCVASSK